MSMVLLFNMAYAAPSTNIKSDSPFIFVVIKKKSAPIFRQISKKYEFMNLKYI